MRLSGGSMSATSVMTTCLMPVLGSTSSAVRHVGQADQRLGAGVVELVFHLRAVYSGLVLTTMSPARMAPNTTMGYWMRFGSCTAMRSPGWRSVFCCR